jgi:CRISPR-associated protein Csd1
MLLQKLVDYSRRQEYRPSLYGEGPVHYIVNLDGDGRFQSMIDIADPSNRRTRRGQIRLVPQIQRSSGIRPLLLADKADYTLGYTVEGKDSDRAQRCHQAYVELVERCAAETEERDVAAVLSFLRDDPLGQVNPDETFDPSGIITFAVDNRVVVDRPAVQAFWASANAVSGEGTQTMQCLVCGNHRPALERLQGKVKGLPGGQTAGTSIVSANEDAFLSYGQRASLISPTCAECGEGFTRGINALLASEQTRFISGNGAFVFWTRDASDFDLFASIDAPEPDRVLALLESVHKGRWTTVDDAPFYALSLSASGGRAVVRDWMDTTVGHAKQRLARWFESQRIIRWSEENNRYYGLRALAFATVREPRDLPVTTLRTLFHAAFTGNPVPWDILYQAVRRNRAEQTVTRPRAALIKLTLLSHQADHEEDYMVQLDTDNAEPAYVCGRLLAVLEEIQRAAMPRVNATIVDRFYGTASTAPQTVFSRLLKGAQPHLSKLQRDKPAAHVALQGRLEEVLSLLDAKTNFPRTMNLEQQGLFSLGYYHQRAHSRLQARENAERRRAGGETDVNNGSAADEDRKE